MVNARRARRPPQSKSKGVALAARMALLSANELRDVPLPADGERDHIGGELVASWTQGAGFLVPPQALTQTLG